MAATLLLPGAPAAAASTDPRQWPEAPRLDPDLRTSPNTIRFSGPDRYQTNLALNLALRGNGDYPFDTSDRTSANAPSLAEADDWWGAATCPRSIIVVAGDTFADALTAASLSDPLDRADGPVVRRVAAADPVFDRPGDLDRVENAHAPIVVTDSGRAGATRLAPTARSTALDLARGGCATAREAVIVGGSGAVPVGVEEELLTLGYDEVFRVAGADRYATAAAVAAALGTEAPVAGASCADADSTDGRTELGFYGSAVAEYRPDARTCILLSRAVVLADGGTGADALAAGWWTSRWQVPVLLTAPDGSLPPATQGALRELDVDTVIVLGGVGRIPETTVDEAKALAGAIVGRIAGEDRYGTSAEMARSFGGWFPTGDAASFADDALCVAASSGSGESATGWGDALAGGPWCARLAAAGVGSPERAVGSAASGGGEAPIVGGRAMAHRAVPILLVPTNGPLPPLVRSRLREVFVPGGAWCAPGRGQPCVPPGFAVMIGGTGAVTQAVGDELDEILSGSTGIPRSDRFPRLGETFSTALDLAPVYDVVGIGAGSVCASSAGIVDARWLALTQRADRSGFVVEADLLVATAGTPGVCLRGLQGAGSLSAVSHTGVPSPPLAVETGNPTLGLTGAIVQPVRQGPTGTFTSEGPPAARVELVVPSETRAVVAASLDLELSLAGDAARAPFTGSGVISAGGTDLSVSLRGTAVRVEGRWQLAGVAESSSRLDRYVGGFRAVVAEEGGSGTVEFRLDGFRVP